MTDLLWLDLETYSECDLKAHGTHRYAEHESTEIIIAQWAVGDADPTVVDCTGRQWPLELVELLRDTLLPIDAHNSAFDRTLLRHCWGIDVPIERWRDTMIKAYACSLPGALGKVGAAMGLPEDEQKDKRGKELIQLFCKPRPKNMKLRRATRETHPAEWAEFLTYSRQDIISMRAVDKALPSWNYHAPIAPNGEPWMGAGARELALWHLDQRINDRGFAVDLDLARAAIRAIGDEQARLKDETQEATDDLISGPSKRNDLLAFILAEYGVALPDMKADTLRRRLEDPNLPDGVKLLISIRLEANKASTAKYRAAVNATSADSRLRNTLQFGGAQRTLRWAGRIFQPQNMLRQDDKLIAEHFGVTVKQVGDDPRWAEAYIEQGVAALKGDYSTVVFDNVMGLTANLVKGCIVAEPGNKIAGADLSNIEGRMLAFLAGEEWKLEAFRAFDEKRGPDLYKLAYSRSFGVDPSEAVGAKRQIGKVQELGLGYEGGVAAFLTFAAVYNMDLTDMADAVHRSAPKAALAAAYRILEWTKKKGRSTFGLADNVFVACEALKAMWREAHPKTVALWAAAKEQTAAAIENPGVTFDIGKHLKVQRDGSWLRIRLPSGRYLCYLQPKVDDSGQITYMGVNQYTRQWCRIKTYGGKIIENADQAASRDVMAHNMPDIDEFALQAYDDARRPRPVAGIVLTVHDECDVEVPDTPFVTGDKIAKMLARNAPWNKGLPLSAAGFETKRYN